VLYETALEGRGTLRKRLTMWRWCLESLPHGKMYCTKVWPSYVEWGSGLPRVWWSLRPLERLWRLQQLRVVLVSVLVLLLVGEQRRCFQ
jgi:hypothetical protein